MKVTRARGCFAVVAAALATPFAARAQTPVYLDAKRDIPARVADLVGRMTLDEKLEQLRQTRGAPPKKGEAEPTNGAEIRAGLGSVIWSDENPKGRNAVQRIAVEQSRLKIPMLFALDVIHGYRTVFPISAGLSCAWDPSLFERLEAVAAREARASGVDWVFGPMSDVARDPRWGRVAETCGEDPYLTSLCVAASVRGLQGGKLTGNDLVPPNRVAACLKHFVGYSADVGGRDYNTTPITEWELRNVHLPPFHAGVDAGALTMMSSFNAIDGIPMSANPHTLNEILRGEWKFGGIVVSDWGGVGQEIAWGYARDDADAAARALSAGNDIEMATTCFSALADEVKGGRFPVSTIDRAVGRMLTVKFRMGMFEHPYVDADAFPAALMHAEDLKLAREAAARSAVLLKSRSALPIRKTGVKLALIGPMGDDGSQMLGTWHAKGRPAEVVTLAKGIRDKLGTDATLEVVKGCDLIAGGAETQTLTDGRIVTVSPATHTADTGFADAVRAASAADVVIMALGEPSAWTGENGSRCTLGFSGQQEALFEAVAATGKPIVVIAFSGRPLALPTVVAKADALIYAWQPGVQAGNGLADVLFGDVPFSGRLTQSVPAEVGQVPVYYNHDTTGRPGRHMGEYRDGPTRERFSFGFGLTGTTIKYGRATIRSATAVATITNTGGRPADEVVQLYVRQLACAQGARPAQELRGFQHVMLAPGEAKEVSFALTDEVLGYVQRDGRFVTDNGDYHIWIAPQASNGDAVVYRRE